MKDINIFYHLFTVNNWRQVFEYHIEQLRGSGLYDACLHIYLGVVYKKSRDLSELDSVLHKHDKITLCFTRNLTTAPVIWRGPDVRLTDGRVGECETILRMTEYAQRCDPDINYLFLHSKGVTNPPTKQRKHLPYFIDRGFDPSESNEKANAFVLGDMSTVISDWRGYVKTLETNSFRYYIYNLGIIYQSTPLGNPLSFNVLNGADVPQWIEGLFAERVSCGFESHRPHQIDHSFALRFPTVVGTPDDALPESTVIGLGDIISLLPSTVTLYKPFFST